MKYSMTSGLTFLMAAASGLVVANLYYNQPLLDLMARSLDVGTAAIGSIPLLTQLGYAAAMLLLVPLGDVVERRGFIVATTLIAAVALATSAVAPSLGTLCAASLATGFGSAVPQLLLPFAAKLARPEQRGRIIGTIMGGLLIGVLGGRIVAGLVGAAWGWREMYAAAAGVMLVLGTVLRMGLPRDEPLERVKYRALIGSTVRLMWQSARLREAALTGGCCFGAFSAFWATLVFFLAHSYGYGSRAAGLFGLVGIVGALAAPLAGRSSDVRSPRWGVRAGTLVALAGYLCFLLAGTHLWGLVAGVILLDLGVQVALVSNQARIYALWPDTPSRTNTVFMVGYFGGGAIGSGLGGTACAHFGWTGVCGVGITMLCVALSLLARPGRLLDRTDGVLSPS